MARYIELDAVVAWAKESYLCENASMIRKVCYKQLVEYLDTLEVKEVDLEKEIQDIFQKYKNGYNGLIICNKTDFSLIAKHFFELGMSVSNKAQKGE